MQHLKVLIDTNMFMVPGKYKVDIFSQLKGLGKTEFYTLDSVVNELERLSERDISKDSRNAKLGLQLIEKYKVSILRTPKNTKHTDDAIIKSAKGAAVCTQDKKLMLRLRREGTEIIYLRQKKYLDNK